MSPPPPPSPLFPYTTLFRSSALSATVCGVSHSGQGVTARRRPVVHLIVFGVGVDHLEAWHRSEEHTSELQSHSDLVCRLLLEKKKIKNRTISCNIYSMSERL